MAPQMVLVNLPLGPTAQAQNQALPQSPALTSLFFGGGLGWGSPFWLRDMGNA